MPKKTVREIARESAAPKPQPICSKGGACRCRHYISRISAANSCNVQVDCALRGRIYRATALKCYAQLPADQMIDDERHKAPSTG